MCVCIMKQEDGTLPTEYATWCWCHELGGNFRLSCKKRVNNRLYNYIKGRVGPLGGRKRERLETTLKQPQGSSARLVRFKKVVVVEV